MMSTNVDTLVLNKYFNKIKDQTVRISRRLFSNTERVVFKESPPEKEQKTYKWEIVWRNVFLLGILHLMAICGFILRFRARWDTWIFSKATGIAAGIGITAGAHRLWTHRAYKANRLVEILLMAMVSTTYQNSVYIWARDHRLHHKFSETDADPHNAKRGFFFSHVGWLLLRKHPDVIEKGKTLDMSDLESNPVVMFQHKYYLPIVVVMTFILPWFIPWYFFNEKFHIAFFTAMVYRYVVQLNCTWGVNSFAHLYGVKPYDRKIGPVESTLMKVVSLGEGYHNYHHLFPWDYKASESFVDYRNLTTYVIDGFAKLGWVWDRKTASKEIIEKTRYRTGDLSIDTATKFNFLNLMYLMTFIIVV